MKHFTNTLVLISTEERLHSLNGIISLLKTMSRKNIEVTASINGHNLRKIISSHKKQPSLFVVIGNNASLIFSQATNDELILKGFIHPRFLDIPNREDDLFSILGGGNFNLVTIYGCHVKN